MHKNAGKMNLRSRLQSTKAFLRIEEVPEMEIEMTPAKRKLVMGALVAGITLSLALFARKYAKQRIEHRRKDEKLDQVVEDTMDCSDAVASY
jgi:hypothetical protein